MAYPANLDSIPQPGSNSITTSPSHAGTHDLEIVAIQAVEAKVGIGASTPTNNTVLRGNGTGTSGFAQVGLTTDVTGTLPVSNGGSGVTTSTGSGNVVLSTSPAITTPTGIVKGDVGLGNVDNTSDATKQLAFLAAAYPVGSIYTNVNSTNPGTLLGFGTWTAFAAGRVIVGVGTSDQSFAAGATGGESAHLLTTPEMPSHTHTLGPIPANATSGGNANFFAGNNGGTFTPTSNSTGGGGSHNNLQPYIVVYMWQRTV